jgi:hypothetical protein
MMNGLSGLERTQLERLLGESLIASDPLIDIRQASAVLDLTVAVVRNLLDSGALPRRTVTAGELSARAVRLADVLAWKKSPPRITVKDAAGILGESTAAVHRLIAVRLLEWHGGQLPLARSEVNSLVARRRGWLTLAQAANALRTSPEEVHHLLGTGALTHTRDVARPVDKEQIPRLP